MAGHQRRTEGERAEGVACIGAYARLFEKLAHAIEWKEQPRLAGQYAASFPDLREIDERNHIGMISSCFRAEGRPLFPSRTG